MIPVNEDLIVNAVGRVGKAVVNIATVRTIHDQLFRVFPVEGVGSGVIINEKCHVLTNNHVVDEAETKSYAHGWKCVRWKSNRQG
jgi:serine protease Do